MKPDSIIMLQQYVFGAVGFLFALNQLTKPFIGTMIASVICLYIINPKEFYD